MDPQYQFAPLDLVLASECECVPTLRCQCLKKDFIHKERGRSSHRTCILMHTPAKLTIFQNMLFYKNLNKITPPLPNCPGPYNYYVTWVIMSIYFATKKYLPDNRPLRHSPETSAELKIQLVEISSFI
jgi:hypothetical protein